MHFFQKFKIIQFNSILVSKSEDLLVEFHQELPEQNTLVINSKTLPTYVPVIQSNSILLWPFSLLWSLFCL